MAPPELCRNTRAARPPPAALRGSGEWVKPHKGRRRMSGRGRTGPASPGSCLPGGTASKAIWELRRAAAHTQRARNESRHGAAAARLLYELETPRGETRCQKAQRGVRRPSRAHGRPSPALLAGQRLKAAQGGRQELAGHPKLLRPPNSSGERSPQREGRHELLQKHPPSFPRGWQGSWHSSRGRADSCGEGTAPAAASRRSQLPAELPGAAAEACS